WALCCGLSAQGKANERSTAPRCPVACGLGGYRVRARDVATNCQPLRNRAADLFDPARSGGRDPASILIVIADRSVLPSAPSRRRPTSPCKPVNGILTTPGLNCCTAKHTAGVQAHAGC